MSQVNKEITQEISEEKAARAVVYNFLSSLFAKEVSSDLVSQLTSEQGQSFLNSLALEPSLSAPINEINTKLAALNAKESLLELAADFCGLFLVDGRASVSPYAGQYLGADKNVKRKSDRPQIFGELHQKMTEFLTDNKLQITATFLSLAIISQ
ncbi:TorD-like chaperone [Colwellia psychrerythraea]|uniref:TorD-like chaperone n=1 Tax=Colwellia psychrerythraea TaxID=28229 RepID=A0A099KC65_COLPS|nr:molecular chaperone TorD [Colwellia psychrerythraea]KGJ88329.1 TorD-like chaperone [Colwellia psychrerythraea]